MKIYLAGPMSGYAEFNFPAFFTYAKKLEAEGYEVFNPAQNDIDKAGGPTRAYRECLYDDLVWITTEADAIAMMPGWEKSLGARAEHATAVACGLEIKYLG